MFWYIKESLNYKKRKICSQERGQLSLIEQIFKDLPAHRVPPGAPAYRAQLQAQRAPEAMVPDSSDPSSCATLPSELGQFSYLGKNSSMLG